MTGRIHVAADGLPGYSLDLAAAAGTPRADFTPDGQPLRIAGVPYRYGIGIHADSRLEVRTGGEFSRFTASVGLQDGDAAHAGKVVFRVYGDAKLLYESAPRADGDAPLQVDFPMSGVGVLELVAVADAQTGELPPVVAWADARLR